MLQVDISLNPQKDDVEDHAELSVDSWPNRDVFCAPPDGAEPTGFKFKYLQKIVFFRDWEKGV